MAIRAGVCCGPSAGSPNRTHTTVHRDPMTACKHVRVCKWSGCNLYNIYQHAKSQNCQNRKLRKSTFLGLIRGFTAIFRVPKYITYITWIYSGLDCCYSCEIHLQSVGICNTGNPSRIIGVVGCTVNKKFVYFLDKKKKKKKKINGVNITII
jgi:hypothetical protein